MPRLLNDKLSPWAARSVGGSAVRQNDTYHVDTLWLMSIRQILAGLLFMAVVVTRDRARLVKLWTTPADRKQLLLFTAFGLLFN